MFFSISLVALRKKEKDDLPYPSSQWLTDSVHSPFLCVKSEMELSLLSHAVGFNTHFHSMNMFFSHTRLAAEDKMLNMYIKYV